MPIAWCPGWLLEPSPRTARLQEKKVGEGKKAHLLWGSWVFSKFSRQAQKYGTTEKQVICGEREKLPLDKKKSFFRTQVYLCQ